MQAGELVQQVAEILQDYGHTTWKEPEILRGLSRGQELIATYRPDASVVVGTVELEEGALQTLPPEAHRFFEAYYNMGDGTEPGRAIRVVSRRIKDASDSRWQAQPADTEIDEVVIDERTPQNYWVSPPAEEGTHIQIGYSVSPTPLAVITDNLSISDQYAPMLIEWALYVAMSRDSEETPNFQRAQGHKQTFLNMLGVKTRADNSVTPNRPDAGEQVPPE